MEKVMNNTKLKNEHYFIYDDMESRQAKTTTSIEKLKFEDRDEHELQLPHNHLERIFTLPMSNFKMPIRKSVSFNNAVCVIPIPMRNEYSKKDSKLLWFRAKDLYDMVQRNRKEFAAEGWDFHNVLEEDQMYLCESTKEFIHPVHVSIMRNFDR